MKAPRFYLYRTLTNGNAIIFWMLGEDATTPRLEVGDLVTYSKRKSCWSIRVATSVPCIPLARWAMQVSQDGCSGHIAWNVVQPALGLGGGGRSPHPSGLLIENRALASTTERSHSCLLGTYSNTWRSAWHPWKGVPDTRFPWPPGPSPNGEILSRLLWQSASVWHTSCGAAF